MKIIDEKGRLFGKLNIIDLLVILLVITAVALFFVRETQKEPEPEETLYELTYQVKSLRVSPETYEFVTRYVDPEQGLKDQLFSTDSDNKYLNAYIVDCVATPHVEYLGNSDGELKMSQSSGDDKRVDVVFTIHAWTTNAMSNQLGKQQIRAGATHLIKTTHFEFSGTILSIDWVDQ